MFHSDERWLTYAEAGQLNGAGSGSDERPDAPTDILRKVRETVEVLLAPIREQLDRERERADQAEQRADRAENRADEEHDRADKAERQLTGVEAELVGARVEAAGLRCKLAARPTPPAPDPPRTRWRRFKAWRRWPA